jgi:hypothetical protein
MSQKINKYDDEDTITRRAMTTPGIAANLEFIELQGELMNLLIIAGPV